MKVCIIIPVHNEEDAIADILKAIKSKLLDVLVINDGSSDQSGQIAMAQGVELIHHAHRKGKGVSLKEGFDYVINNEYDGAITMDGDGQHDPEDLEGFLKAIIDTKADVIIGNRMENAKTMPFLRLITNRLMSFLISLVCGQTISDSQCGYRYISANALNKIKLITDGFEIESEIIIKAARQNLLMTSIPIKTIYKNEKSKIHPVKDTIRFLNYIIKEIWISKR